MIRRREFMTLLRADEVIEQYLVFTLGLPHLLKAALAQQFDSN